MFDSEVFRFQRLIKKLGATVTLRQVSVVRNQTTGTTTPTNDDIVTQGIIGEYEGEFANPDVSKTLFSVLIKGENLVDGSNNPITPKAGDQMTVNGVQMRVLHVIPGYIGTRLPSFELIGSI